MVGLGFIFCNNDFKMIRCGVYEFKHGVALKNEFLLKKGKMRRTLGILKLNGIKL
jgi:hypothetical protein